MDLSPDVLLSILFVAIIANSALMVAFVVGGRSRRRRRDAAIERTLAGSIVEPSPTAPVAATTAVPAVPPTPPMAPALPPAALPDDEPEGPPSGRDAQTGLLDAPAFARLVALEEARVARYHRPATIVIFELDGLERLTDSLGGEAGERVIIAVADTVRRLARDADRSARLAPGRFAVLLAETDEIAAINYVERVRRACELWLESGAMALRLAAGWAGTSGDPTLGEAQRVAVERMYAELRRGAARGGTDDAATPALTTGPTRIAS
jgi:diguanylate cyclase (GGDEF)-like protein